MINNELTFLGFSLLMQFSVGLTVLFNAFIFWPAFNNRTKISRSLVVIPSIALGVALVATLQSIFQLGKFSDTLELLNTNETSTLRWMVLSIAVYLCVLSIFLVFTIAKVRWKRIQKVLLDVGGILGLAVMFLMSQNYMLGSTQLVNPLFTYFSFYGSTLLLGAVLLLVLISKNGSLSGLRALAGIAVIIVLFQLVWLPLYIKNFEDMGQFGLLFRDIHLKDYAWFFYGRMGFLLVALATLLRSLYVIRSSLTKSSTLLWPLSIALLSATMAEIGGRILFYTVENSAFGL